MTFLLWFAIAALFALLFVQTEVNTELRNKIKYIEVTLIGLLKEDIKNMKDYMKNNNP